MKILNVEEVVINNHWGWSWFAFGLICAAIAIFGLAYYLRIADIFPGLGIGLIIIGLFMFRYSGPVDKVNQYEMTCTDDYTWSQLFVESHTFIEKRGDIWVWQDNWEGDK